MCFHLSFYLAEYCVTSAFTSVMIAGPGRFLALISFAHLSHTGVSAAFQEAVCSAVKVYIGSLLAALKAPAGIPQFHLHDWFYAAARYPETSSGKNRPATPER